MVSAASPFDTVRVRILSELSAKGSLPLTDAARVVNGLHSLAAAGAVTEANPVPYFHKASRLGSTFAGACNFGQTAVGSFVFSISVPLSVPFRPGCGDAGPFGRRVTMRVLNGMHCLRRSSAQGSPEALAEGYTDGLSANMCEAVGATKPLSDPDARVEYSVNWSGTLGVPADTPRSVSIGPRDFEYLEVASKIMRHPDDSRPFEAKGLVVKLSSDSGGGTASGSLVLRLVEPSDPPRLTMPLDPSTYRVACDAHRATLANWENLESQGRTRLQACVRLSYSRNGSGTTALPTWQSLKPVYRVAVPSPLRTSPAVKVTSTRSIRLLGPSGKQPRVEMIRQGVISRVSGCIAKAMP